MKFSYKIVNNKTFFNYEVEDDIEIEGKGETKILKLKEKKGSAYFNYVVKKPHNDIMSFIFLIIYHPFIKKKISFNHPISPRFIENCKKLDQFKDLIIDAPIKNIKKYQGKNNLIPMGGGMDSTSIMCLFKDAYLYHQEGKEKVDVEKISKELKMRHSPYSVSNNLSKITDLGSFTHWISVFVGGFLIAMDKNVGNILLGSPLGVCIFKGQNKFIKPEKRETEEENIFLKNLGINFIYPLAGCTELISSKILVDEKVYKNVIFCDKGNNNLACHKCIKCFRKNLELNLNGVKYPKYYFKNYKINDVQKQIKTLTHIYLYKNPSFYKEKNKNLYEELKKYNFTTSWCAKIYDKIYFEEEEKIYLEILQKLKKYAPVMNESDILNFESYDGNNYDKKKIIESFNYREKNLNIFFILILILIILILRYKSIKFN